MAFKRSKAFYLMAMLGFAIINSLLCVLFMFVLTKLTDLLFTALPEAMNFPVNYWPLVYCLIGGILVGIVVKKVGLYPKLLLEVFGIFKKTGRMDYKDNFIPKDVGSAFVILLFGAALGPEAVLAGLAGSIGTYTVDLMERNPDIKTMRQTKPGFKRFVFILQWAIGVVLFISISTLLGLPSFIYRYTETTFHLGELIWFIPLLLLGVFMGLMFIWASKAFEKLFKPENGRFIHSKALLTAAVLGVTGIFAPMLLFSGEEQIHDLVAQEGSMAPELLIIYAVAKLLLAALCLHTGWRGGNIFPIVFASFSLAFGLTALLPIDTAFSAAIILVALLSFVTKQPVLIAIFVFLYFPPMFIPLILLAALLACPKESRDLLKAIYHKLSSKKRGGPK